jgi:hypothetical protein
VLALGDIISASRPATTKVQKVKEPDTFDSTDSSKLDEWITQVTLYFTANPTVYESDEDKVVFALSYLRRQAAAWFQPDLLGGLSEDEPEPAWVSNFVAFINELVVNFGPHDPEGLAESKLELLQMKDSDHITKFLVKFNLEAGRTRWGDAALRRQFYKALPNRIKDLMTRDGKPTTLALMKLKAQEYDARHWEREAELAREKTITQNYRSSHSTNDSNKSKSKPNTSSYSNGSNSNKASSSKAKVKAKPYANVLGKDGKLLPEERKRRQENGLCMLCGVSGHVADSCPKCRATGKAASVAKAESKADSKN